MTSRKRTDEDILLPDLKTVETPSGPVIVLRAHLAAIFMLSRMVVKFFDRLDFGVIMRQEASVFEKFTGLIGGLMMVTEAEEEVYRLLASLLANPDGTNVTADFVRYKIPPTVLLDVFQAVVEQEDMDELLKKVKALGTTFRSKSAKS